MNTTVTIHMNKGEIAKGHNQRKEELCKHEKHIDLYNRHGDSFHEVLFRQDLKDAYAELFSDAIEEFNSKQKNKDRRKTIESYMEDVKNDNRGKRQTKKVNGKRVVDEEATRQGKQLEYEITVKVGNTEREYDENGHVLYDANNHHIRMQELPRELQREIHIEYCESFQKANPNFKVTSIDLHGDEGFYNKRSVWEYDEIHPHITFIPFAHFGRGLSVQNSMNKALAEMGYGGADGYEKWTKKEQARLEEITLRKYREYCQTHPDYALEHGELEIIHPVQERTKQGDMEKDVYARQQELAEEFLATEIEQNQREYAIESIAMTLDERKENLDDYKHRVDNYNQKCQDAHKTRKAALDDYKNRVDKKQERIDEIHKNNKEKLNADKAEFVAEKLNFEAEKTLFSEEKAQFESYKESEIQKLNNDKNEFETYRENQMKTLELGYRNIKKKLKDEKAQLEDEKIEHAKQNEVERKQLNEQRMQTLHMQQQAQNQLSEVSELYNKSQSIYNKLVNMSDVFLDKYATGFGNELGNLKRSLDNCLPSL